MSGAPDVGAAILGDAVDGADRVALARLVRGPISCAAELSHDAIAALAAAETVLWLPPWTVLDEALLGAIGAWLAGDGAPSPGEATGATAPRCALARSSLDAGSVALDLPRSVVLSRPGAVFVHGAAPSPRPGATRTDFPPLRRRAPATLSEHLRDLNRQTTVAARRLLESGGRPTVRQLALAPLALFARSLARARGPRRQALPRAVLEAYRGTLVAAKLWELREVGPRVRA